MSTFTNNTISTTSITTAIPSFLNTIQHGWGKRKRRVSDSDANSNKEVKRRRMNSEGEEKTEDEPILVYRELENYLSKYPRFNTYNNVTKFVIRSVSSDPEGDLEQIFGKLINKAEKNTPGGASMYNVLIFADGLENPISIPMRPAKQNSPEAIVHQIAKVGKSATAINLLNAAMTVYITTVAIPKGGGGKAKRKFDAIEYFGGLNNDYRIRVINNDNNYCMFIALEMARLSHDDSIGRDLRRKGIKNSRKLISHTVFDVLEGSEEKQTERALELMGAANIPTNLNEYDISWLEKIQNYYDQMFPGIYRIVAFDHLQRPAPLWFWPDYRRKYNVAIYLENDHWDAVRNIEGFFLLSERKQHLCVDCGTIYRNVVNHGRCPAKCRGCGNVGPEYPCKQENGFSKRCHKCRHHFNNEECFLAHYRTGQCNKYHWCYKCSKSYEFTKGVSHDCSAPFCLTCKTEHNPARGCYVERLRPKKAMPKYRLLAFDFESSQDTPTDIKDVFEHHVNFISAKWTCTECCGEEKDECKICREIGMDHITRKRNWSALDGIENPLNDFVKWILTSFSNNVPTYAYAHAGGHYDHHFVLQELCKMAIKPKLTINGCKIYEISTQCNKLFSRIIFRDSYRLTHSALDGLPKMLGLDCTPKLFFPHLFNKKDNYDKILATLPEKEDYCCEAMREDKFKSFNEWYAANYHTGFILRDQLKIYCENDVDILIQALIKLRQLLIDITSRGRMKQFDFDKKEDIIIPTTMDVLPSSQTIATVCMNIYKRMFLGPGKIPIVPERGYERNWRQSPMAIKFLEFLEEKFKVKIMHAGNGMEKCFVIDGKCYYVDGYDKERHWAMEILGCYIHGCPYCYGDRPNALMVNKKTAVECYGEWLERKRILETIEDRQGRKLKVRETWECEIKEAKTKSFIETDGIKQSMREFFDDRPEKGRINPRSAYAGGRTGPCRLYAEADEEWEISMADIVSLYPFINYTTEYPTSIPNILIPDELRCDWRKADDLKHLGLYKARVIPPTNLFLPVLPFRTDDRLLFPLCSKCAKLNKKETPICKDDNTVGCNHRCNHSDIERSWVGVFTHLELRKALEKGYRVDMCYRIWHWPKEEWSNDLFKNYVRLFLRLKIESSSWPTDEYEENNELQEKFVETYRLRYDIEIDKNNMKPNPGMRALSKLALNSLWGKFSMKNDFTSSDIVNSPSEYFNILLSHQREVTMVIPMSEKTLRVVHRQKEAFIEEHSCSNIIVSLLTTSAARLHLYSFMEKIENSNYCRLLYTDTDSVIYAHKKGQNPLTSGEFLGEMSFEYKGFRILEFCSAGSKQYGLKLQNLNDPNSFKHVLKLRGITMDKRTSEFFNFRYEKFKEMVMSYGEPNEIKLLYRRINPDRSSCVTSRDQIKRYNPVCKKGILRIYDPKNMTMYPFGYLY